MIGATVINKIYHLTLTVLLHYLTKYCAVNRKISRIYLRLGTDIRGLVEAWQPLPQGDQEPLVAKDKVAHLIAPIVPPPPLAIFSSNKIQSGHILVLIYLGCLEKYRVDMSQKMNE